MSVELELSWPIRASFTAYVAALPDGVVMVEHGARREGGSFLLRGSRTPDSYRFDGTIRFTGHLGVLDVTFDGIELRPDERGATVRTTVSGVPVDIATTGPIADGGGGIRVDGVRLTGDGAALLGGVYPPGEPLDPLEMREHPTDSPWLEASY